MTIHKFQGLSLDCAIVDLSDKVFAEGRLHLIAFDPQSVRVSVKSLGEINRLRKEFRKDLPLYAIPSVSGKRKLTGAVQGEPALKKARREPRPPKKRVAQSQGCPMSKEKKGFTHTTVRQAQGVAI